MLIGFAQERVSGFIGMDKEIEMETKQCPRCESPSVACDGSHCECISCGFYFNPSVLAHFLGIFKKEKEPDEMDIDNLADNAKC